MLRLQFLLIECLPVFILLSPLVILKYRKNPEKCAICCLLTLYLTGMYALTGLPTVSYHVFDPKLSLIPFQAMAADLRNAVLNVILFMPLGFFLPLTVKGFDRFRPTLLTGLTFTAAIELLQIFTSRATDINDLITNLLGTVLGYTLAKCILRHTNPPTLPKLKLSDLLFLTAISCTGMFFLQHLIANGIWKNLL